ncbi:MAG: Ig-like domain-containing protein [Eubacterium sp.]|nr:Ig-like domain-containing protein [Eubacterium sp.]
MRRAIRLVAAVIALVICVNGIAVNESDAAKNVSINKKKLTLMVGESAQLKLNNVSKKDAKSVKWKSSDKKVASVNKTGLVKGKSKGKAKITARYKKKNYTCKVTVKKDSKPASSYDILFLNSNDDRIRCRFSDDFFTEDSTVYNKELAKCSLATALLSERIIIPSSEGGDKSDLEKLTESFGFMGFSVNDEHKNTPTEDSVGVACAYKKQGKTTIVAVLFRSTEYDSEWVSNMDMGDGSAILNHEGFELSRRKVSEFILNYLDQHNIDGKIKFWVTGQSRGAAIANLTSAWLVGDEAAGNGIKASKKTVYAYCFATPLAAFAGIGTDRNDLVTGYENIHNMIFDRDLVSRIPPKEFGFGIYGVTERGKYGTDENEVKNVLKQIDETAYNAFTDAEGKDYGGMSRSDWVDSYAKQLAELVGDRKTYTEEWQDTFTYGVLLLFTKTTPTVKPDQKKLVQLMNMLASGGATLFVDHYPQTEYAYIATGVS